jgi:hypothetical protein
MNNILRRDEYPIQAHFSQQLEQKLIDIIHEKKVENLQVFCGLNVFLALSSLLTFRQNGDYSYILYGNVRIDINVDVQTLGKDDSYIPQYKTKLILTA